jgi:hypothetical protein
VRYRDEVVPGAVRRGLSEKKEPEQK